MKLCLNLIHICEDFWQTEAKNKTKQSSPVGIGERDEGVLLSAIQHEILGHLTKVGQTQWRPEQELR